MLEHKRPGLLAMALAACLVDPRHGQASRRFHDVLTVWIVALDAIHLSFRKRVMLGKVELGVDLEVALKTRLRIFARVDNELVAPGSAHRHVFARGPMARFTAGLACH